LHPCWYRPVSKVGVAAGCALHPPEFLEAADYAAGDRHCFFHMPDAAWQTQPRPRRLQPSCPHQWNWALPGAAGSSLQVPAEGTPPLPGHPKTPKLGCANQALWYLSSRICLQCYLFEKRGQRSGFLAPTVQGLTQWWRFASQTLCRSRRRLQRPVEIVGERPQGTIPGSFGHQRLSQEGGLCTCSCSSVCTPRLGASGRFLRTAPRTAHH